MLTAEEVAAELGVSIRTVRRYAARGILPGRRIGPRLIRFRREDVEALKGGTL